MIPINRNNNDQQDMHHQIVLYTEPEPVICKWFGCGKTLTAREQVFGDRCQDHTEQKKIDIMMVLKYE